MVSLFDPDQIITREQLGRRATSEESIGVILRELLDDSAARKQIGDRAHAYALKRFSPVAVARQYMELIGN